MQNRGQGLRKTGQGSAPPESRGAKILVKIKILSLSVLAAAVLGLSPPLYAELSPEPSPGGAISFDDAARMAVASSRELRSQYAQRVLKEGAWAAGFRAYLPRLSLSASEDDRLSQTGADSFQKTYSASLDQLVWDGGRTSSSRALEKAELALLGFELERTAWDLAASALSAYRRVLSLRMLLEIREAAASSLNEQRRILGEETRLGLALETDLAEADISAAEAELEAQAARLELDEAELALTLVLGVDTLPPLGERVDLYRELLLPPRDRAVALARERNPGLITARFGIARHQAELRYYERLWIPTVRVNTGLTLSGPRYPLTRSSWTVGLTVNFASPWFSGTVSGSAGWDPPFDRNMRLGTTASPFDDPASALNGRSVRLALVLETEQYQRGLETIEKTVAAALERCAILDRKRVLFLEARELAARKVELSALRVSLGQMRRVDFMEDQLELAEAETGAVEAALAVLEAERELERLLDLAPGGLEDFTLRTSG
jgi:outer membrane protein TolC